MLYVECFLGAYDLVGAEGQWACLAALVGAGFSADPFWWLEGWEGGVDEGVPDAFVFSVADQGGVLEYVSIFFGVLEEVEVGEKYSADGVVVWVVG